MSPLARASLLVFAGGALGSWLRFVLSLLLPQLWLLWVVNVLGAAALGVVQGRARHSGSALAKPGLQLFWGAGFCGGFTTMSGLAVALVLLQFQLGLWQSVAYALGQVVAGLVAQRVAIGVAAKGGNLD